jgi:acyl transferase domain-containing protein
MNRYPDTHVAVIGLAVRFPGADSPEALWRNLRDGVESIRLLTEEELLAAGVSRKKLSRPNFVRAWGDLPDIDRFDAAFFGINPLDAAVMDPQHRAFLEVAWEALEDAGGAADGSDASIGVFAGSGMNAYMAYNLLSRPELVASRGEFAIRTNGNDMDFLTTRASYLLDLRGPAVSIQTACSTSLVAVHFACQSLIGGECDVALAGGVTIALPQLRGYLHREGDILSPDGHCRAFDASAAGTVFGSGVGLVVLKPLNDAVRDGNRVRAVIRGSAINNDGASKVGYTAPSVPGQAAVVAEALEVADAAADSISYVEAHGTGTAIGDPIEVAGLTKAFRAQTSRRGFCALGSLKTNVGHLDTASGVAGLIKVILSLENRRIPPSLHFESPNPNIDFEASPFYVNSRLTDWTAEGMPRRAGVSSLGVGGTNAHVIVEEAPELPESGPSRSWQLVTLSAKTRAALDAGSARLSRHIGRHPEQELADVAYTLAVGRRAFGHRRFAVCHDADHAQAALEGREPERLLTSVSPATDPGVFFMFPGGGAQYANMGLGVYRDEPRFREFVDECLEILRTSCSNDVGAFLLGDDGIGGGPAHMLEEPSKALPALFTIEHSLARLWQSWGVEPAAMIGHSLGEYAAACLAGVFTLRDALALVTERGRLMETLSDGAMLSIPLTEREAEGHLPEGLSLAAINAPSLCVASGAAHLIEQLERSLSAAGVEASRLHIAVAAHSALVEPILGDMRRLLSRLALAAPRIPFVSNVTGTWITEQEARDPEYWVRHLRSPVRFSDGLKTLLGDEARALLEVGPGRTLTALARQHTRTDGTPVAALQSMRHPRDERPDMACLLDTVGRLWLAGARIDWKSFYGRERRRPVSLPTYAFQRERYWIDPGQPHDSAVEAGDAEERRQDLADWFYVPVWKETPPVTNGSVRGEAGTWLVFDDPGGVGSRLARRLGKSAVVVQAGSEFRKISDDTYAIAPGRPEDYVRLLKDLAKSARVPRRIAHLWNLTPEPDVDAAFHSLVHLAQALGEEDLAHPVHIGVVSSEMQQVSCEPHVAPAKALLLGPCKVIPREFQNLTCSSIDVDVLPAEGPEEDRLLGQLLAELSSPSRDDVVAYRGRRRWVLSYEPLRLEAGSSSDCLLRQRGTYLITGGLGELALAAAVPLAETWKANLVLVGRAPLDGTSRSMSAVRSLEARGATVLVFSADVTDLDAMRNVVRRTVERFGGIDGVIHAAGVLADGAIQTKTRETAAKVLAPKVKGTLVLDEVLEDVRSRDPGKPDFVALFSSITAVVGIAGQVDHAAANAFLDAFARRQAASGGPHTVSINWGPWQEIGQAAKGATHPLIDDCTSDPAGRRTYTRRLSADEWLLAEHRVKGGEALLAGVTHLELIRAMMADGAGDRAIEIRDVYFLAPFVVPQGPGRELRATLDVRIAEHRISIASTTESGIRREHVRATARYVDERPERHDVRAIMMRCDDERLDPPISQAEHVHFGPRWQNVRRIRLGAAEALVTIELADRHHEDLARYGLHPAMLDMATGGAHCLIPGHDPMRDLYVPFSYGRVRVYRRFPPTILSHVRYRIDEESLGGTACFDVSIMDEAGNLLVDVSDYVVRRVADPRSITGVTAVADETSRDVTDGGLKHGIPTDAGVEALYRVLAGPRVPQVIVSPVPIRGLMAVAARGAVAPRIRADGGAMPDAPGAATIGHARPPLATPYVAPAVGLQETIARVWQRALGIRQIGVHDDFFELGGHSLMVVGIHEELRRLGVTFPVAKAFQHSTVASLAAYLSRHLSGAEPSAQDPADRAKQQKEALARRRPALSGMREVADHGH